MKQAVINEVLPAVEAIKDSRLMFRDGAYLARGRDAVVAQGIVEQMMRDDLIHRVGSGMYELTTKGKQMARQGGAHG